METGLPDTVRKVLVAFEQAGFEAYIVGGAVRDILLGAQPQDYDITTNARPEEVAEVARLQGWRIVGQLGRNFGVVVINAYGASFETATFRGERYGYDSHRPEEVWFAESLTDDLARRDFTINAMAMARDGCVVDIFGGQQDLKDKLIKAVGEPELRFQEDGLRMFRACRFAAQLGFKIDSLTLAAIAAKRQRVSGLSLERVKKEFERLLVAPHPQMGLEHLAETRLIECSCTAKVSGRSAYIDILPELRQLAGLSQNREYHCYDAWQHTLETVRQVPPDLVLRWAALLHDCAKGIPGVRGDKNGQPTDHGHDKAGAEIAEKILARFQMQAKFTKRVSWLISRHMRYYAYMHDERRLLRRWIHREAASGEFRSRQQLAEAFRQLTRLCVADIKSSVYTQAEVIKAEEMADYIDTLIEGFAVHTRDIAYKAVDLRDALGDPSLIGPFLKNALTRIQSGQLQNNEQVILMAARRFVGRNRSIKK